MDQPLGRRSGRVERRLRRRAVVFPLMLGLMVPISGCPLLRALGSMFGAVAGGAGGLNGGGAGPLAPGNSPLDPNNPGATSGVIPQLLQPQPQGPKQPGASPQLPAEPSARPSTPPVAPAPPPVVPRPVPSVAPGSRTIPK